MEPMVRNIQVLADNDSNRPSQVLVTDRYVVVSRPLSPVRSKLEVNKLVVRKLESCEKGFYCYYCLSSFMVENFE